MRKKFTRALALACALVMLAPATAPAYAEEQKTQEGYTGGSIIESDNSVTPELPRVVLPTINADTYDFTIDVEGLLHKFDSSQYDGSTVYFNAEDDAAKLELPDDTGTITYSFVLKGMVEAVTDSGTAGLGDDILTDLDTATTVDGLLAKKYYVWQPKADLQSTTGEGDFILIDNRNYNKFFTLEFGDTSDDTKITGISLDATPLAGKVDEIWDGKVYKVDYTAVAEGTDAAKYYDATKGEFDENLFVKAVDSGAGTTYLTPIITDTAAGAGQAAVTYTAATTHYTGTSNKATITNKSTFDIGVIADVTMTAPGLNFVTTPGAADNKADISVGIADAAYDGSANTNIAYVTTSNGANTAQAAFVIPCAGGSTITYQTDATDPTTGGHKYFQYLKPVKESDYKSASFVVTASADSDYGTNDDTKKAWDDYIDTVKTNGDNKPTISIVYKFVKTPKNAADNGDWAFTADNGAKFVIDSAAQKPTASTWATYDDANATVTPGFDKTSYEYIAGTATNLTVAGGNITALGFKTSATGNLTSLTEGSDYTVSGNVITIPANGGIFATQSTSRGASGKPDITLYLVVQVDGSSTYETQVVVHSKTN